MTTQPGRAALLEQSLVALRSANIRLCMLHGFEHFPFEIPSDVDCIASAELLPKQFATCLASSGLHVVQHLQHESTAHYFVLADEDVHGRPVFLQIDASSDYRRNGRVFYSGEELMSESRDFADFVAPATHKEFACYLIKRIAKGSVEREHEAYLSRIFQQSPSDCRRELARFWPPVQANLLAQAALTDDWRPVEQSIKLLRSQLLARGGWRALTSTTSYRVADFRRLAKRVLQPTGLHVVVLGADGSGKSAVLERVEARVGPAFRRTERRHFSPSNRQRAALTSRPPVVDPHGAPPRPLAVSVLKAGKWLIDFTAGYAATVRPALTRSTLVLFDRYLPDTIVDPARYRYGGPAALPRLIWRIAPRPDLVLLLDAPTEVLRQRKQEVPACETERQRQAYRDLVLPMKNGRIIDAARPLDDVVATVERAIFETMERRAQRRLGWKQR